MTVLTDRQVAGIVNSGGGPPSGTTTAQWVALARRESHFDTDVQDFLASDHWGLWQIGATTHFSKYGSQYGTVANFRGVLKSPLVNWNVASRLYTDQKWAPWRFSGPVPPPTSQKDKDAAANPDTSIGGQGGGDLGGAIPEGIGPTLGNPLDKITDILGTVLDPIKAAAEWLGDPHNWTRIVQVVGGVALGIVAVSLVIKPVVEDIPIPKGLL